MILENLPPILQIHVDRFKTTASQAQMLEKCFSYFSFEEEIDMKDYLINKFEDKLLENEVEKKLNAIISDELENNDVSINNFHLFSQMNERIPLVSYFSDLKRRKTKNFCEKGGEGADNNSEEIRTKYILNSVIVHTGTLSSGHYFMFGKRYEKGEIEWFYAENEKIELTSWER
jgi:ubiquitin C-terminal hydrolase